MWPWAQRPSRSRPWPPPPPRPAPGPPARVPPAPPPGCPARKASWPTAPRTGSWSPTAGTAWSSWTWTSRAVPPTNRSPES
ncbi:hypothetical protein FGF04_12370 [Streptomyces apricus]|uniref:Uncharacterized protein n=1 Tax=Streptomyces apricus TaxID=1828112 RepID=A0A5B0BEA5_9ACTN|nr:hypothetical protein FGF04_12370 [Streptomyces apricus]